MNLDALTLERIKTAHPLLRSELLCIYKEMSESIKNPFVKVRFSWVRRSRAEQNKMYAQGRTTKGPIVTWVKEDGSFHYYGLAVDIVFLIDKDKNGTFEAASWDTLADWDKDGIADWLECARIFMFYGWQWGLINSKGKQYDLPHFQKTFGLSIKQLRALPKDAEGYPIITL